MVDIVQILVYILGGGLASAIGFTVGYLLSFVETSRKKERLRKSLYREIVNMYNGLNAILGVIRIMFNGAKAVDKDGQIYTKTENDLASRIVLITTLLLHNNLLGNPAATYKFAKSDPNFFFGIKDKEACAIDGIYASFLNSIFTNMLTSDEIRKSYFEQLSLKEQLNVLKEMCEDIIKSIEEQLRADELDKKLLIEMSDPTNREKMAELIHFNFVERKKWYQFCKK